MDRNLRELFHSAGNNKLFGARFVLPGVLDISQDTVMYSNIKDNTIRGFAATDDHNSIDAINHQQ